MYDLKNAKNFTPHPVTVFLPSGKTIEFPSVGNCRAKSKQWIAHEYDFSNGHVYEAPGWGHIEEGTSDVVLVMKPPEWDGVDFVPHAPAEDDTVIVSIIAAPALVPRYPDLTVYVPDTGPESAVRDETGRIRGVKRLILWRDPTALKLFQLVQPFNPANPGDGHRVLSKESLSEDGIYRLLLDSAGPFASEPNLMLDFPNGQPRDVPNFHDASERRKWAMKMWEIYLYQSEQRTKEVGARRVS